MPMNTKFNDIIYSLPELYERLVNYNQIYRNNLVRIPKSGIYVFYENGIPMFVGRTNSMKDRIITQGRPGSNHNAAPLAFLMARKAAEENDIDVTGRTRGELEKDPIFNDLFIKSKIRVSKMSIRLVLIEDQITQAIFQIYASMELNTPYNDFKTH